jgi:AcrR family transcriptional regulator
MDKTGQLVRQRVRIGPPRRGGDRRVRRTEQALVHALVQLVLEKRYDAITIQNLLDRADVGRSTFYSHYRGKDDLLLTSFRCMLDQLDQMMERDGAPATRVAPVRELFTHVGAFRSFERALARAHMLDRQYRVGVEHMSAAIARRLAAVPAKPGDHTPAPVKAQALAGALFALLRWWVENDSPYSPEQMDEMFHAIR